MGEGNGSSPKGNMSLVLRRATRKLSPSLLSTATRFICTSNPDSNQTPPTKPTSAFYDQLISQAAHTRDFATIQNLFTQRIKAGCFNTSNTFNFLAHSITSLLPDLTQTLFRIQDRTAQNNAFESLISFLCKSHIDEALYLLDEMLKRSIVFRPCTFYPIISTLARTRQMGQVQNILAFMKNKANVYPDITCYNYVLSAHCHVGDLSAAVEVLKMIEEDGLEADSLTFDAMVLGACRVGRVDGAMAILRRMEEHGLTRLYSTYGHVITGLLGVGCFSKAVEFVRAVGGRDERLDGENFGILAMGLVRKKRWQEVRVVFKEMEERGLKYGEKLRQVRARLGVC